MAAAGLLVLATGLAGCGSSPAAAPRAPATMMVSSPDLAAGTFPARLTCEGGDQAPVVTWSAGPAGTAAYALEMTDPDAPGGTFVHWLLYYDGLGARSTAEALAAGAREGTNSFGHRGYSGPCPPRGSTHHYHLAVFALGRRVGAAPGLGAAAFEAQLRAAGIIATGEVVAAYRR